MKNPNDKSRNDKNAVPAAMIDPDNYPNDSDRLQCIATNVMEANCNLPQTTTN
jgi:tetrahydromethanopterin S-methyltransferase subunit G